MCITTIITDVSSHVDNHTDSTFKVTYNRSSIIWFVAVASSALGRSGGFPLGSPPHNTQTKTMEESQTLASLVRGRSGEP